MPERRGHIPFAEHSSSQYLASASFASKTPDRGDIGIYHIASGATIRIQLAASSRDAHGNLARHIIEPISRTPSPGS